MDDPKRVRDLSPEALQEAEMGHRRMSLVKPINRKSSLSLRVKGPTDSQAVRLNTATTFVKRLTSPSKTTVSTF